MEEATVSYFQSERLINNRLDDEHIRSWRDRGFALVHDLLPQELLAALKHDALAFYPEPNSKASERYNDFSSSQRFVFPSRSTAFNAITLHPTLLQAVADLLGVSVLELRLTQSDLWPKYGSDASPNADNNADQRMHCDYPNHSLVHPPEWDHPDAVEMIVYLNSYDECEGATAVVPRRGPDDPAYPWPITQTPGVGDLDYINDRLQAEAYMAEHDSRGATFRAENLYPREEVAKYRFGSVLLYRHDTWHRGRPVKPDTLRLVQNLTFTKSDREWLSPLHSAWSWSMYEPDKLMEKLIAQATVAQRTVLGFPAPGHEYWTAHTLAAVEARYRAFGIDMTEYHNAL
jgi:hypothetical protein